MNPNPPAIEIENLTVSYGQSLVVDGASLSIPQGVATAIVGPNGAGKTTLIKAMLGLVKTSQGTVRVLGKSYQQNRQAIAYVPQRTSVDWDFPTTVFDVVMMGAYGRLKWFNRPGKIERRQTAEAIDRLGMSEFSNRQIGELSGGQQQRTFLARALVQDSPILVLDEPLQGVDATTEQSIVELFHSLRKQGRTIICVHHDLSTVTEYFDWVVILNRKTVASGLSRETFTSENVKAAYGAYGERASKLVEQLEKQESP